MFYLFFLIMLLVGVEALRLDFAGHPCAVIALSKLGSSAGSFGDRHTPKEVARCEVVACFVLARPATEESAVTCATAWRPRFP